MNTDKLFSIVLSELASDNIKKEFELERVINSDLETQLKVVMIKELLANLTQNDSSIARFTAMLNINNNVIKKDENEQN